MRSNILAAVLLSSFAFNVSAAEPTVSSMVSTHVFPTKPHENAKSIICFSNDWMEQDFATGAILKRLNNDETSAVVFDAENHSCFDQKKFSRDGQEAMVTLLNRIDTVTDSQIAVPVEISPDELCEEPAVSLKTLNSAPRPKLEINMLRNENRPLLTQVLRATAVIQGAQVLGLGVLMVMPPSITNWNSPVSPEAAKNFKDAWTKAPVWDKDRWEINFIGHPLSGAGYYNALRGQGSKPLTSFVFSSAQSLVWEYGFEAINERPSIQDMLFTSTIGSVLGEGFHQATMKMSKNGFNLAEKIVVTIINPMYVVNNGYKKKDLKHKW